MTSTEIYETLYSYSNDFHAHGYVIGFALVATFWTMLLVSLCGGKSSVNQELDEAVVNARNSKLAVMLIMLLLESPEENRNYIRLARSIGYDHLIKDLGTETG